MKRSVPAFVLALTLMPGFAVAQPPESPADDNWTPIEVLVEQVAEEIDREFIIDRRVRGIEGFTTNNEVDYESLLSILRINDLVAVESGDQILVMPEGNSRAQPTRILQEDDSRVADSEVVTRVIEIPPFPDVSFSAAQLVPVLRPMMSQSAQLGAIPGTNQLVLVDRYDNVRRMTAVIDAIIEGLDD